MIRCIDCDYCALSKVVEDKCLYDSPIHVGIEDVNKYQEWCPIEVSK